MMQSQSLCVLNKAQGLVLSTARNQQVERGAIRMPDHIRRDKASSLSGGSEVSSLPATSMSSNNSVASAGLPRWPRGDEHSPSKPTRVQLPETTAEEENGFSIAVV